MGSINNNSEPRLPVICVDPSSVPAFQIFNPNDWIGDSRAVVQSCWTELSVLHYGVVRIADMCRSPKERCQGHFENLKGKCNDPAKVLPKVACYVQVPELHVQIEAFFSGMKSLLDLIVQLLWTEDVVGVRLPGFHRKGNDYGGKVLKALANNACADKRQVAEALKTLIIEHKGTWIDDVVRSRDSLIHPTKGARQLMFELRHACRGGTLVYEDAVPPSVGNKTIDRYSAEQIENAKEFARAFLALLRCGSTA